MDIQSADWLDLAYKPTLPNNRAMGMGVIGAGEIVEACHLPAYSMGGFNVVGIYEMNRAKGVSACGEVWHRQSLLAAGGSVERPERSGRRYGRPGEGAA